LGSDQRELLLAAPALDLFFASNGVADIVESLEVHQAIDIVIIGEAGNHRLFMFQCAAL
jgi:hypothetical protein